MKGIGKELILFLSTLDSLVNVDILTYGQYNRVLLK